MSKKRVILKSPFAGDIARNTIYLRRALRDSIDRGEAPFAPHAIYPQVLDDNNPDERQTGLDCGMAWAYAAQLFVFYLDHGMSPEMEATLEFACSCRTNIEFRYIGSEPTSATLESDTPF